MDSRAFSSNALVMDAVIRNKLIHAYSDVDAAIVWDVVKHDLPALEEKIGKIMKRA